MAELTDETVANIEATAKRLPELAAGFASIGAALELVGLDPEDILALVAAAREGNEWKRDTTVLATENRKLRARLARIEAAARRLIRECDVGIEEQMATALTRLEAALEQQS